MRGYLLYIFSFILFFILHYIEGFPTPLGLSIAQLWKLPLLFYLLVFSIRSLKRKYAWEKYGYGLAIESTLNVESILNPLYSFTHAMKQLPLTLFFRYWLIKYSLRTDRLEIFLYSLAQFILLASLFVLLGFVTPIQDYLVTHSFSEEGTVYYSAVFGSPHGASSYFAASILVLLNGFKSKRFRSFLSKGFNLFLVLVGLVSIFQAYVRTGWLMLLVGVIILMLPKRITPRYVVRFLFVFIALSGSLIYLYTTNEKFQVRVVGRSIYSNESANKIDIKGSGRIAFWVNGIENWSEGNAYELLFGRGWTKVVDYNYQKTGMRVFSHNQFVNALVEHGLVGLVLLSMFYFSLYRLIRSNRGSPYYRLSLALFLSALLFSFFQSEIYFLFSALFSLALALLVLSGARQSISRYSTIYFQSARYL